MRKAFTVIELVLVLALFAILFGLMALYSQTDQVRSDLNAQTTLLVSSLRLAQSDAASGKGGQSYGIHFEADRYILFEGDTYVVGASANEEEVLPDTLSLLNINLNGGGTDVIFSSPQGETDQYGTLELSSDQIGQSKVITILSNGSIHF